MMSENKNKWEMTTAGSQYKIDDDFSSIENRFTVGFEKTTKTPCIYFPVFNHHAEYMEYYWLEDDEYRRFLVDHVAANEFASRCKRREMDERLMFTPGRMRGWA